jgi:hypothetical protein
MSGNGNIGTLDRVTALNISGIFLVVSGVMLILFGMYKNLDMAESVNQGMVLIALGMSALGVNVGMSVTAKRLDS